MKLFSVLILFAVWIHANSIGIIASLKGSASITREGKTFSAHVGQKIFLSDAIQTQNQTKAQILFDDKTVLSLGKNSFLEIADYFNDDKSPKASFKIKSGFFKVMTGKIGKLAPNQFRLITKTSTIGIRGTHFLGLIKENLDTVVCTNGSIKVTANFDQSSVNVYEGQITFVEAGKPPMIPRDFDVKELHKLSENDSVASTSTRESIEEALQEGIEESQSEESTDSLEAVESYVSSNSIEKELYGYAYGYSTDGSIVTYMDASKIEFDLKGGTSLLIDDPGLEPFVVHLNSISGSFSVDGMIVDIGKDPVFSYSQGGVEYSINSYYYYEPSIGNVFYTSLSSGNYKGEAIALSGLEYVMYGYWSLAENAQWVYDSVNDYYYLDTSSAGKTYYGEFVLGEVTPANVVQRYIDGNRLVSFSGNMSNTALTSPTFALDISFGSATPISGTVGGYTLNAGGTVDSSGFNSTNFSGINGSISGNFYGPNLEEIGGVFINHTTPSQNSAFAGSATSGLY